MAALRYCSVADVTLRLKATQAQATLLADALWYGGEWFGVNGAMYFRVVGDGATQGLLYWGPTDAEFFWSSYSVTTHGAGTLVQGFTAGALDVTLRFRTVIDEGGAHYAECYCDDVLVDTWVAVGSPDVAELVSRLWLAGGGKSVAGAGFETYRVGPVAATIWGCGTAAPIAVVVDDDDQPALVSAASHLWTDWVLFVAAGGDPDDWDVAGELFAEGFWDYYDQLAVDGDGCMYAVSQEGDSWLGAIQTNFRKYRLAAVANLSIGHHAVADTLLVTDAGLSGGTVGWWKVQNK